MKDTCGAVLRMSRDSTAICLAEQQGFRGSRALESQPARVSQNELSAGARRCSAVNKSPWESSKPCRGQAAVGSGNYRSNRTAMATLTVNYADQGTGLAPHKGMVGPGLAPLGASGRSSRHRSNRLLHRRKTRRREWRSRNQPWRIPKAESWLSCWNTWDRQSLAAC